MNAPKPKVLRKGALKIASTGQPVQSVLMGILWCSQCEMECAREDGVGESVGHGCPACGCVATTHVEAKIITEGQVE